MLLILHFLDTATKNSWWRWIWRRMTPPSNPIPMIQTLPQQSMTLHNGKVWWYGDRNNDHLWSSSMRQGLSSSNVENDLIDGFTVTARCLSPTASSDLLSSLLRSRLISLCVATFTFACCRSNHRGRQQLAVWNLMPWRENNRNLIRRDLLGFTILDSILYRIIGFPPVRFSVTFIWQEPFSLDHPIL
jgi:hypothetical protein